MRNRKNYSLGWSLVIDMPLSKLRGFIFNYQHDKGDHLMSFLYIPFTPDMVIVIHNGHLNCNVSENCAMLPARGKVI